MAYCSRCAAHVPSGSPPALVTGRITTPYTRSRTVSRPLSRPWLPRLVRNAGHPSLRPATRARCRPAIRARCRPAIRARCTLARRVESPHLRRARAGLGPGSDTAKEWVAAPGSRWLGACCRLSSRQRLHEIQRDCNRIDANWYCVTQVLPWPLFPARQNGSRPRRHRAESAQSRSKGQELRADKSWRRAGSRSQGRRQTGGRLEGRRGASS
jgi:hypothetical protein